MARTGSFFRSLFPTLFAETETPTTRLVRSRTAVAAWSVVGMAVGLVVMAFFKPEAIVVGWLWALASAAAGGLVGFLFAIPKTQQLGAPARTAPQGTLPKERQEAAGPDRAAEDRPTYYVNTNLEDISDWLTKILVGVTLIESKEILAQFQATAHTFAHAVEGKDGTDGPKALGFAFAVMVHFAVAGFVFGYLVTRLFLTEAFRLADTVDLERIDAKVNEVTKSVQQIDQKVDQVIHQQAAAGGVSASGTSSAAVATPHPAPPAAPSNPGATE